MNVEPTLSNPMNFQHTWRWFGSYDTIPLKDIRQTGATGIVTALHHIPPGEVWPVKEIQERKKQIEDAGLKWTVVESLPVHEDIKKQTGNYQLYIENYKQSIRNLAECDIHTVCYNFMPVLDWTRTDLDYRMDDGSTALRFDATVLAAFELFILELPNVKDKYSSAQIASAEKYFRSLDEAGLKNIEEIILLGLPGDKEMNLEEFKARLDEYRSIDDQKLKSHLFHFLGEIIPVAEKAGVRMAIHPDDPPFPIMGLPRIVSTEEDARQLIESVDSPFNGLTFCVGSFGARADNDLPGMIGRLGHRINFVHFRSVHREENGSFHEARHLEGHGNIPEVMQALIQEQQRRKHEGRTDLAIPIRPDHGHRMLDDLQKKSYPGYSGIGRLRGLAELRGLEIGLRKFMDT